MGHFKLMEARVGVWIVGPNHDGGGHAAQLASLGSVQKQCRLSLGSI
jgi:hypothetical protein